MQQQKLDYNYRILREMDTENQQTAKVYKTKVKRLKEALNAHSTKYAKQNEKYKNENKALAQEYQSLTEQFEALQKRYRQAESVDRSKYLQVRQLNIDRVSTVAKKLLTACEIIYSQVLGKKWNAIPLPVSDKLGLAARKENEKAESTGPQSPSSNGAKTEVGRIQLQTKSKFTIEQIRGAIELIVNEFSFLVERRLKKRISNLPSEEQILYMADAILPALGITDQDDVEQLVSLFYK